MAGRSKTWTADPATIFWVVTAAAFGLRLIHILAMSNPVTNPTFLAPVTDAGVHHRWAQEILDGTWPGPEPFFRAPLYPYFLAGLYGLFGTGSALAVQLMHGLVSALGAGLAALCARRLWSARAAWSSGLLMAGLWSSIFYAGELLAVSLSVTLNLLLLWLVLGPHSPRRLWLAGIVLGLSALTRPTVLVILPVLGWYLWRRAWQGPDPKGDPGRSGRLPGWAWLALGLVLIVLPVTVRNLVQGGEPVLIAASGGVNFYIGNNPHSEGRVAFLPGAPHTWQGEMSDVTALAATETGRPMTALAADRYFWHQGLRFWLEQPAAALRLTARKAWLLLAANERSNNKNLAFWRERSVLLRWPVWPSWALVLGLAILGLGRSEPGGSERLLLGSLVAIYAAALLLFFINARFRLPLLAWLVVPAGGGLDFLWGAWRARTWPRAMRTAGVTAALVAVGSFVPDALTYHQDPATDFESWRGLGNSYLTAGDERRTIDTWERALAIDAASPERAYRWVLPQIYVPLAQLYERQRQPERALAVYRRWVNRLPASDQGRMGLAEMLLKQGLPAEAAVQLDTVLQRTPDNSEARLGYGWALYQAGNFVEARRHFGRVVGETGNPGADLGLGQCLLKLGELDLAEAHFKGLAKRVPGMWQVHEQLAGIYAKTGRPDAERKCWRKVLEHQPAHGKALQRLAVLR